MISQISVKPSPSMSPHSTLLRHLRYNRCGDCTVTLKRDQKGAHFLVFRTTQLVISKLSKGSRQKKRYFYGQADRKGLPPPLTVRVL